MKIMKILLIVSFVYLTSCQINKEKEEYFSKENETSTIYDELAKNPDYATYLAYIEKYRYKDLLRKGNSLTIWAPTNKAFAEYTGSIDSVTIKEILNYSINVTVIEKKKILTDQRIKSLGNKNLFFNVKNDSVWVNDAFVIDNGKYTRNGVIYRVNKVNIPLPNIWEYIQTDTTNYSKYINYVKSYNVYDKIDTLKYTNKYLDSTALINSESHNFTFLLANNSQFDSAFNNYKKYFVGVDMDVILDSTNRTIIKEGVYKNMIFNNTYLRSRNNFPYSVVSIENESVIIDKSMLLDEIKCSNGVIYKLKKYYFSATDKFLKTISFESNSSSRLLTNSLNAVIQVQNSNIVNRFASGNSYVSFNFTETNSKIAFAAENVPAATYNVYLSLVPSRTFLSDSLVSTTGKIKTITRSVNPNTKTVIDVDVATYKTVYFGNLPKLESTFVEDIKFEKYGYNGIQFTIDRSDVYNSDLILNLDAIHLVPVIQ